MQTYMDFIRSNHGIGPIAITFAILAFSCWLGIKLDDWNARKGSTTKTWLVAVPLAGISMVSLATLIGMITEIVMNR